MYFAKQLFLRLTLLSLINSLSLNNPSEKGAKTQCEDNTFLIHLQLYVVRHKQGCLLFIIVPDRGRGILKENIHNNILLTGALQCSFCPLRLASSLTANKSFI